MRCARRRRSIARSGSSGRSIRTCRRCGPHTSTRAPDYAYSFVLYNDIAWQLLPLELGLGSGQTCWRRLDRWQRTEVFDQLHRILLAELNSAGKLARSRACVDGSHIRAKKGRRHRSVAG
ncbi:transposase [Streptomyces sp. NPDC001937]